MESRIKVKSNRYGLSVSFSADAAYEELIEELKVKFQASSRFFQGATMAVSLEGRSFTAKQEDEIMAIISEYGQIHVLCLFDSESETERIFQGVVERSLTELPKITENIYRGSLHKKQLLRSEENLIILGDVDYGATIECESNVIVMGTIRGSVHAGCQGDPDAFIAAIAFKTHNLKICNIEAGRMYTHMEEYSNGVIAHLDGVHVYIDPIRDHEWKV